MSQRQSGYTLVEILVALAVLVVLGAIFSTGFLHYQKLQLKSKTSSTVMRQINNLVENIRPNLHLYQVNFDPKLDIDQRLQASELPMAWSRDYLGTAADCPGCPGRMGYILTPSTQSGLFLLTMRVTNTSWGTEYIEYQTFMSIK